MWRQLVWQLRRHGIALATAIAVAMTVVDRRPSLTTPPAKVWVEPSELAMQRAGYWVLLTEQFQRAWLN
ncbi:MAG: hypothetical protein NZ960_06315 [Candidatus Kapabacteria bacterium]|nr:hypothetical protein [Candidatus Kapabacteria bacterium]MDW8011380.1 hypothetical protein [Bacteroidota bacterium]